MASMAILVSWRPGHVEGLLLLEQGQLLVLEQYLAFGQLWTSASMAWRSRDVGDAAGSASAARSRGGAWPRRRSAPRGRPGGPTGPPPGRGTSASDGQPGPLGLHRGQLGPLGQCLVGGGAGRWWCRGAAPAARCRTARPSGPLGGSRPGVRCRGRRRWRYGPRAAPDRWAETTPPAVRRRPRRRPRPTRTTPPLALPGRGVGVRVGGRAPGSERRGGRDRRPPRGRRRGPARAPGDGGSQAGLLGALPPGGSGVSPGSTCPPGCSHRWSLRCMWSTTPRCPPRCRTP